MEPDIRVDKWLWQARFFKSRSLTAKMIAGGGLRVNGVKTSKASTKVKVGDYVIFPKEDDIREIEIVALGTRRGPAPEAQSLYIDHAPPQKRERPPQNPKFEGKGRPTKKDRRAFVNAAHQRLNDP